MKIGQYLANIWTRDEWLLFLRHGVQYTCFISTRQRLSAVRAWLSQIQ